MEKKRREKPKVVLDLSIFFHALESGTFFDIDHSYRMCFIVAVRTRSEEEARHQKLWLKKTTIGLSSYFRRFDRTLRKWLLVIL
ncbi:LOW QUALITY PROTEIN: hypothetical protein V1477_019041 [Vespula maculifrons]|uniref:PIN domain-containing protein n=1 Tax=Vespula maculifrons TaxID=7453 RepID=A0ABD2AT58_VESMC